MTKYDSINKIGMIVKALLAPPPHRLSFRSAHTMDDQSAADENESAASSLQQTDLSCSVGLSNGGDECPRRVEEDGSHSLSPYFERRRSRSLVLPANPASWSESGHAELTAAERSTHRQRRESRSATLTKDRVDTAVHRQLVCSSQGGSSLVDREVGGKAASPTTWRNEEDETVFLFDDERSVEVSECGVCVCSVSS